MTKTMDGSRDSTDSRREMFRDLDAAQLSGRNLNPGEWRVFGNNAQMVDAGAHGPLSAAVDDDGVNTCVKGPPNAPGFEAAPACVEGSLSGAWDGAAAARRTDERLAYHRETAGEDIEDPDGIGRRIT